MKIMNLISKYKKLLLIASVLVIGIFIYFIFIKKEVRTDARGKILTEDDYEYFNEDVKDDTLANFGFCANENYVIKEDADVRRTPNKAMYNSVYKLKFGTKVYTKNIDKKSNVDDVDPTLLEREKRNNYIAIYAQKPVLLSEKPVGYINIENILEKSEFKNYKPKPKVVVPIKIESAIKATIESNLFIDEMEYVFSKDTERFNKSIIYGDFNNDGNKDFAVILDSSDNLNSIIQIYFNNPAENIYKLVFKKRYASLLKIKLIEKENEVMINSEITTFPLDGVLISNPELNSFFHIYNPDSKNFMVLPN